MVLPFVFALRFEETCSTCQNNSPQSPNRRFKLDERSQVFVGTHHTTLSIAAMCLSRTNCSGRVPLSDYSEPFAVRVCSVQVLSDRKEASQILAVLSSNKSTPVEITAGYRNWVGSCKLFL
jgi:hypothetical protein